MVSFNKFQVNSTVCNVLLDVLFTEDVIKNLFSSLAVAVPCIAMKEFMLEKRRGDIELFGATEIFKSLAIVIEIGVRNSFNPIEITFVSCYIGCGIKVTGY